MSRTPVVLQYAAQFVPHDAITNEILAFDKIIRRHGWKSKIACRWMHRFSSTRVMPLSESLLQKCDLALVHYGHELQGLKQICLSRQNTILIYHGITPAHFFAGTNTQMMEASARGALQLSEWANRADHAVCHSHFLARELTSLGFRRVSVLPYVLNEELYMVAPDAGVLDRFRGDRHTNLITVGRVVPHKAIEDCIFAFDHFQRHYEHRSRLFIVGSYAGAEAYYQRLIRTVGRLGTRYVIFTGAVSQAALLAYYQLADAFLMMSEHEGFGVPLVEAMRFGIPVFAYCSSAVPETLGSAGTQFTKKDWPVIAESVATVLADCHLRERILQGQREQAARFNPGETCERWSALLESKIAEVA